MSEPSQGPGFHPLYLQVKELLIQRVLLGDWKPGEVLPSETKLAAEYQVSQGTVRKAIEEMAADRLVVRYQGKGTYVAARGFNSSLHFFSIVNADDHVAPAGTPLQFDWLECPANEREQRELHLAREELVYRIYRVRPVDGRPALIERISVASARFPGLAESMRNSAQMNAYLIMEKDYNTLVVRADEWLDAVNATEDDAAQLGIAEGTALLRVHRVSYALDGAPVERRTIRLLSTELRYRNTLR